jgi:predicted AlkP superfamily pyrophosphatase or phosphodiesterase
LKSLAALALCITAACQSAPVATSNAPPSTVRTSGGRNAPAQLDKPYLILISFDGFRADYLDRYDAPNFTRLAREGVRSTGMIPVFPSKTFPNHYSIVTGDYPAKHGIVSNRFWDPARQSAYALGDEKSMGDGTWYTADPIWVTAEQQGMVTASFDWPGGDAAISGVRPARFTRYKASTTMANRTDSLFAWLTLPDSVRPHFIALYNPDVDHAGHNYGPWTPQVASAIAQADSVLGVVLDGVARLPIATRTYVIVLADHGMTEVSRDTYVEIGSLIDTAGVMIPDGGPVVNLYVAGGKSRAVILRDSLNRRLEHGRAYLAADIPARFHYRSNPRIGDLVVIMDEHWQLGRRSTSSQGQHGFDNMLPSMRAIFLATGPGIKRGLTIAPFENIHVYSLMTDLLGIVPAPGIDGKSGFLKKQIMQ